MAVPPPPLSEELEAGNPQSLRKQPQHNPGLVRAKLCSTSEYLYSLPGKGREKEQRDDRETGRQTQREMENRETERKHAERNEIDGDRNAETEILRDKEEKLETNSKTERDRQGQKDEESLRWRHEGPPTSIPPGPLS